MPGDTIGSDGLSTVCRLLQEHVLSDGLLQSDVFLLQMQCPAFAFVSGYYFLSLERNACKDDGGEQYFQKKHFEVSKSCFKGFIFGLKPLCVHSGTTEALNEEDAAFVLLKNGHMNLWLQKSLIYSFRPG